MNSRGHGERVSRVREGRRRPQNRGKTGPHEDQTSGDKVTWEQGDCRIDTNRDKDTMRLVPLDAKRMMVARLSVGFWRDFRGS